MRYGNLKKAEHRNRQPDADPTNPRTISLGKSRPENTQPDTHYYEAKILNELELGKAVMSFQERSDIRCRSRNDVERNQQNPDYRSAFPANQQGQQRESQIKLFLDAQRPGVVIEPRGIAQVVEVGVGQE
jgi:hypothetical protein